MFWIKSNLNPAKKKAGLKNPAKVDLQGEITIGGMIILFKRRTARFGSKLIH